jgi:hypothetical protein
MPRNQQNPPPGATNGQTQWADLGPTDHPINGKKRENVTERNIL